MTQTSRALVFGLVAGSLLSSAFGAAHAQDPLAVIKKAVAEGTVACKLTEPAEIVALLGEPQSRKEVPEGGMIVLEMTYPGLSVRFGKYRGEDVPFTLIYVSAGGKEVDIGRGRPVVLRRNDDLRKIDRFEGLQNVSLARLDLREEAAFLDRTSFSTLTSWPPAEKLPEGFDPAALLKTHQTPGLGVRDIHVRGLDGRGVGVAIIDQPLLLGHQEYASRIIRYDATGLGDMPPQMHGSPVTSILVGKSIGVAPRAALTYFAVPMWKQDNLMYVEVLRKIFELNKTLPEDERVRVVSISTGMFSRYPHFEEWKVVRSEAEKLGILVVTCDPNDLKYGILKCQAGQDPDDARSYRRSGYAGAEDVLLVPGAGRTLASFRGDEVYMMDRDGGMSWGAPYIAGLAALAFQVDPKIAPRRILELLVQTALRTEAGPVVDPAGFIEAVQRGKPR